MATFTNLYFAGEALRMAVAQAVQTAGVPPVVLGLPQGAVGSTGRVTVSLMLVNEEPAHKNDPPLRNADGTMAHAPTSLSATYLVSTEGETGVGDMAPAHEFLGEVLRRFHDDPSLDLTALGLQPTQGEGKLHVALVPTTPDLAEKLFTPLQAKLRPFALYEIWPIQLRTTKQLGPAEPVVKPGGIVMQGPAPVTPPRVARLHPNPVALGRTLRIDGEFFSAVQAVVIEGAVFSGPDLLPTTGLDGSASLRVVVDPARVRPGLRQIHVTTAGGASSEPLELSVLAATEPSLDGPAAAQASVAVPLVLSWSGPVQAVRVHLWPEAGVADPSEVHAVNAVASVTDVQAVLVGVAPGSFRASVELVPGPGLPSRYLPFIVLEVTP